MDMISIDAEQFFQHMESHYDQLFKSVSDVTLSDINSFKTVSIFQVSFTLLYSSLVYEL